MKHGLFSVTKNALANLIRGGATAAVAIVLPRFLTRSLDTEHFSAWSLILQIAAYASYLDFGLQLAVARFIAQALELEQKERQARLVSTALLLLSLAAFAAFTLTAVLVWFSPKLFHGVASGLITDFRCSSIVLSLTACMLLPLSTYTGVLIGLRRNEIPALAIGGTRIAGAAAAILAAHFTQSLTVLAFCIGIPNLAGGLIQVGAVRRLLAQGHAQIRHVSAAIGRELLQFCAGLATWSVAMLLISGLDVTIVGHFQFAAVGSYSLAAMLVTFFSGLVNAALSALMAPVAALHARGERSSIVGILVTATQMTVLVNLVATAAIFLCGGSLLRAWVGPVYAAQALPIVKILACAQTLRLALAPYSVMLISIGEQNKNIIGAVCEAVVNVAASVYCMVSFGPVGVAWGTLAGAVCGVLWLLVRTMPQVTEVSVTLKEFLRRATLPAAAPFLPLFVLLAARRYFASTAYALLLTTCACATAAVAALLVQRSLRRLAT